MSLNSTLHFIENNTLTPEMIPFIKKEIVLIHEESWGEGYNACLQHIKRRRIIKSTRLRKMIKNYLDWLDSRTHGDL